MFNAKTGKEVWRFESGLWMRNAAAVNGGRVYVTNGNELFGLDAADGSVVWRSKKIGVGTVERAPTVADDIVYQMAGSSIENLKIQAFDATTGERQWATPIPYPSEADPCIVNGRVYVGAGEYHAFDPTTGEKRWMLETNSEPVGMAFTDDAAYFAEYDRLYAVQ